MDHPLVKVSKYIFLPYALYLSYFYLQLQHPEYLSKATGGIIQLRPAVGISDLRQLLIVGTPSSGTVVPRYPIPDRPDAQGQGAVGQGL